MSTNPQMDPAAQAELMRKCEDLVRAARTPWPSLWLLVAANILAFICGILVTAALTHTW